MKKIKISVISYLNTSPFIYGLKRSKLIDFIDLCYDTPAECAMRLKEKAVDAGIVPAAMLPSIPDRKIISNYCIGASGKVRSVVLCANQPVADVKNIYLDVESRTSTLLAELLAKDYWEMDVAMLPLHSTKEIHPNKKDAAFVLIGDKVFDYEDKFKYKVDLAEDWQNFTGLPFAFATWTAVTPLSNSFISDFNHALSIGVNNIPAAVEEHRRVLNYNDAIKYLTENIDYDFNFAKHKALLLFWNMVLKLKSKYRSC